MNDETGELRLETVQSKSTIYRKHIDASVDGSASARSPRKTAGATVCTHTGRRKGRYLSFHMTMFLRKYVGPTNLVSRTNEWR